MKNEELLNEALSELYADEFSAYEDMPEHEFPKYFDKKMNSLFDGAKAGRGRTRLFIAVGFVAAAVLICGASVVLDVLFRTEMNDEFIFITAESLRDAPEKIEHYYEPDIPEEYIPDERYGTYCTDFDYTVCYVNKENNKDQLIFTQRVINAFNIRYYQDQHKDSPQWIKDDDPENNSFDMTLERLPGYHFEMDYVERFWTDGRYIYSVNADRAVIDSLNLENLHEVFPEVHDHKYYYLEDKENE